ncbi:alpha/beta hydrolase [Mesorhizobium sp. B4-1-4]|uniref:alpha/beta hydrolase n=1 Tax=Mesorhizobium sp. B4-1-4 TaxID=2589888 RepID=UPI001127F84B|nr:alpha/beta hydrolase [Mesorhizobium sp. B4-1-4]UCI31731.1 alpha/beta hydrolase [Mesorhizobium sp. B4-1-4]
MTDRTKRSELFPGEQLIETNGLPVLAYRRTGLAATPLVVFLTGGGILARIAYGHPDGNAHDFLDHWLADLGWGLIAASYPCDHPLFDQLGAGLQLDTWARMQAVLVAEAIDMYGQRPIVAAGWSMGGRLVFALTRALRQHGLRLDCFVSLCGTPPFPRLTKEETPPERLLPNGLWDLASGRRDGTSRDERWLAELAVAAKREGRAVISPSAFADAYRVNVPHGLWGPELEPYFGNEPQQDRLNSLLLAGSFSGEDYPVCAAIVPLDRSDFRHALSDQAVWGEITVKGLVNNRMNAGAIVGLSEEQWAWLREFVIESPKRLTRYLSGGHFFFVGETGAKRTADLLRELHTEVVRLEGMLIECQMSPQ